MSNATLPFKRVFVTGALVSALSLSAIAAVSAQESTATPEAPAAGEVQAAPGFLGVRLSDSDAGVTVVRVLNGSPAEAAGLAEGDIITAVNGEAVESAQAVADAIGALAAGDTVTLGVTRGEEALTLEATLASADGFQTGGRGERNRFNLGDQSGFALRFNADDQAWGLVNLSEDSALYAAGLRSGDLITAIDGSMYDPMQLLAYVGGLGADATLTLEVLRQGETIEVAVPAMDFISGGIMAQFDMGENGMGMLPFEQMVPGQGMPFGGMMGRGQGLNGRLGLAFVTLDETVAAENNVTLTDGALVVEVEADSPAAEAGLQANDVIVAVNGEPVDAERTLRDRLVAYEAGDTITLTINRGGEEQQIDVTLGEPVQMGMGQMFQIPVMPGMDGHGFGFGGGMGNGQGLPPGHPAVPGMPAPEATPEASGNPA